MRKIKRPNILYIYTDQQRLDSLSCCGGNIIDTPNLDALASDGAVLEKFYVNNPVCSPSRMSFLTGRYCSSLGVGTNGVPMPKEAKAIHNLLKPYNYTTAQIGKLHFDPHAKREHKNPTSDYGFDTFILSDEPGCYHDAYMKWVETVAPEQFYKVASSLPPAALLYNKEEFSTVPRNTHEPYLFEGDEDLTHSAFVTSEICSYLDTYNAQNPFFAIAGFYAPHTPLNPPKKYLDRVKYENIKMPVKGIKEEWMKGLDVYNEEDFVKMIAYYYALVAHVDDCVGQIIAKLKEKGMYDDTVIVFTSDHGEYLGDHGKVQKGMPGFDCITNVPCIVKYKDQIEAGTRIDTIVEAVDILPTMLEYASVQVPTYVQGKSIKNLLAGKTTEHKTEALIEWLSEDRKETTIKSLEYMYSIDTNGKELLYHTAIDPYEINNVVDNEEYKDVLSNMRKTAMVRTREASYISGEIIDFY